MQDQYYEEMCEQSPVQDTSSETSSSTSSGSSSTTVPESANIGVFQLFSNSGVYSQTDITRIVIELLKSENDIISAYVLYDTVVLVSSSLEVNFYNIRLKMLNIVPYWVKIIETPRLDIIRFNEFIRKTDNRVYNKMLSRLCGAHYSPVDIRGVKQAERRSRLIKDGYSTPNDFTPTIVKKVENSIYLMNRDIDAIVDPSHIMFSGSLRTELKYDDLEESNNMIYKLLLGSTLFLASYLSALLYIGGGGQL